MSLVKKNQVEFVHGHGVLERATTVRVALAGEDGTPGAGDRLLDAWTANAKALMGGEHDGFAKVLAHAETDQVLRVHLVGPHVTDLIAEPSVGMLPEATAWEIAAAVHPHPTLSEAIGEAAMAVAERSINS
jgi:pyruvate/2-oxoglutarate dehydrogenase complex dihydrolipoamide dehydrogenase (E3) component